MSTTLDDAKALKKELETEYQTRHDDFRTLRNVWHGRFDRIAGAENRSISSIFRDYTAGRSDIGPDIKVIHNIIQEVCVKYQTFLSSVPMIRCYVDHPQSDNRRKQATLKERALYGVWSEGNMARVLNQVAWYLPLMGDCFLGIWPDFDRNMPVPLVRSPESAYPVLNYDKSKLDALIFSWKIPTGAAKRAFPGFTPDKKRSLRAPVRGETQDTVEVLEFSDDNEFARWVDGKKVKGVKHDFGFNLFEQLNFIHVPGEPWNHGAVEQAVGMNEAENALRSLLFQAVLENIFPTLVLEDPSKAPEEIDKGPGGVIPLNAGGKAYYLAPALQALPTQMGFMEENKEAIRANSGMPGVMYGESPTTSIATGKAINELQGAGTGSTVEMVQGAGIGTGLVAWNEKALYMFQTMFKDKKVYLHGKMPGGLADINPRQFGLRFEGKEIVGSQRNEVVFQPHLSMHEKVVMGLQMAGGGLVSKQWQREQVGIPDSQAMEEEMVTEAIESAVVTAIVTALQAAGAPPEQAADAEAQALAYLQGQTNFAPGNPPAPATFPAGAPAAGGGGEGGFPVGPFPSAPGGGQVFAPPLALPPGAPVPTPAGGAGAPAGTQPGITPGSIPLEEVITAIQGLTNIAGRVFLVGEIVQTGSAADDIEVAITNPADQRTISDGLPQYAGLLLFHPVDAEPGEPYIEVTPGVEPMPGGAEEDLGLEDDEAEEVLV